MNLPGFESAAAVAAAAAEAPALGCFRKEMRSGRPFSLGSLSRIAAAAAAFVLNSMKAMPLPMLVFLSRTCGARAASPNLHMTVSLL